MIQAIGPFAWPKRLCKACASLISLFFNELFLEAFQCRVSDTRKGCILSAFRQRKQRFCVGNREDGLCFVSIFMIIFQVIMNFSKANPVVTVNASEAALDELSRPDQ
ncbi:MAG: hypothetical protein AAGE37_05520 [Pseudomonadota bacterium]